MGEERFETLRAELGIVTPMFLGAADQKPTGIRPASVKGALRFWWRALAWGRVLAAAERDIPGALRLLHDEEGKLFGLAAGKEGGGQGVFLLRIGAEQRIATKDQDLESSWPEAQSNSGYLGLGLWESGKAERGNLQGHRAGIREGGQFTVEILFKPKATAVHKRQLQEALAAWGLLGGLGSRNRRGFGSVALHKMEGWPIPANRQQYEAAVTRFLVQAQAVADYPPYTAFSARGRFGIQTEAAKARTAHGQAGGRYKDHRGQKSSLRGRAKIPFGLPLQDVDEKSRRASPLFFHVHPVGDGRFVVATLFLPALFHPEDPQRDLEAFYRHVESFVTDLQGGLRHGS